MIRKFQIVNSPPHRTIDPTLESPLWMVTNEPVLNELVMRLQRLRRKLLAEPTAKQELYFSRARLEAARAAFAYMIRQGEEKLHQLCRLLGDTYFTDYQLTSVVIGEIEQTGKRFTFSQGISIADLYSSTDLDLGSRQLRKIRFAYEEEWSRANLIANVVEYQPTRLGQYNIHKLVSRIKAEEEIWNKVVDEIFDLDSIVIRDKQLRYLSRYVKDIFGIKIIVSEMDDIYPMHNALMALRWTDKALGELGIPSNESTRRLAPLEVKDYLGHSRRKLSDWEAVKSVVRWGGKTFEIQIQSLRTFMREREYLTKESHISFKTNRERVRAEVAGQIPLFGFYQELLRWLFLNPDDPPPRHQRVRLHLTD